MRCWVATHILTIVRVATINRSRDDKLSIESRLTEILKLMIISKGLETQYRFMKKPMKRERVLSLGVMMSRCKCFLRLNLQLVVAENNEVMVYLVWVVMGERELVKWLLYLDAKVAHRQLKTFEGAGLLEMYLMLNCSRYGCGN